MVGIAFILKKNVDFFQLFMYCFIILLPSAQKHTNLFMNMNILGLESLITWLKEM